MQSTQLGLQTRRTEGLGEGRRVSRENQRGSSTAVLHFLETDGRRCGLGAINHGQKLRQNVASLRRVILLAY